MPLKVSCPCGQEIRVADAQAGQQVKCPACFQILQVPGGPPAPANGLVEFSCTCGMAMKAKAEHAGMLAACPRCQAKITIPAASTPARVSAPAPAAAPPRPAPPPPPKPAAAPPKPKAQAAGRSGPPPVPPGAVRRPAPPPVPKKAGSAPPPSPAPAPIEEDSSDPLAFRSSPVERAPRYARRRGFPWKSILLLLLLLGGAGGAAYWWFWLRPGPLQQSLSLVPDEALGFASVRVAEVWKSGVVQKALEPFKGHLAEDKGADPVAALQQEMQKRIGLTPEDIDQLTLVVMSRKPGDWFLIIASSRSLNKNKIVNSHFMESPEETKNDDGVVYYRSKVGEPRKAVYFVNRNICVAGEENQVLKAMKYELGRKPQGPLAPALQLAAQRTHDVVVAAQVPEDLKKKIAGDFAGKMEGADSLLALQAASFILDLKDPALAMELTARFPSDAAAAKVKAIAEKMLPSGKAFLQNMAGEFKGKLDAKLEKAHAEQMKAALDSLKLEQKGADVTLRVQVPNVQELVALPMKVAAILFQPQPKPVKKPSGGPAPPKNPADPPKK